MQEALTSVMRWHHRKLIYILWNIKLSTLSAYHVMRLKQMASSSHIADREWLLSFLWSFKRTEGLGTVR